MATNVVANANNGAQSVIVELDRSGVQAAFAPGVRVVFYSKFGALRLKLLNVGDKMFFGLLHNESDSDLKTSKIRIDSFNGFKVIDEILIKAGEKFDLVLFQLNLSSTLTIKN